MPSSNFINFCTYHSLPLVEGSSQLFIGSEKTGHSTFFSHLTINLICVALEKKKRKEKRLLDLVLSYDNSYRFS